jgi:hypothetical protein
LMWDQKKGDSTRGEQLILRAIQSHLLSEGATIPVPTELICLPFNFDLEFVIYFILKHSSLHRKRLTTK